MIGRLRGVIIEKRPPELILECGGVGYEVWVPLSTFAQLPEVGREIVLHTHFVVREDAQLIYGFAARQERELFRELIKVSGIGPKIGLAVLSGMTVDEFLRVIHEESLAHLTRIPGIGKKTAERLLIEMRDKLKDWMPASAPLTALQSGVSRSRIVSEAVGALVSLGYKPAEASRAIAQVDEEGRSAEELIRMALRQMAK